jgi:hypothetical protein
MENLTDREKQALTEILEDHIDNLRGFTYLASIELYTGIATKLGLSLSLTAITEPTMETLTFKEKLALVEVLDYYIYHLYEDDCTQASITFHRDLAEKLNRILYSENND